jgi:hypothetical protein
LTMVCVRTGPLRADADAANAVQHDHGGHELRLSR